MNEQRQQPRSRRAGWLRVALHEWDVPCPACGYNLRDLKEGRCPECGKHLTVNDLPDAEDLAAPLPRDWITVVGVIGAVLGLGVSGLSVLLMIVMAVERMFSLGEWSAAVFFGTVSALGAALYRWLPRRVPVGKWGRGKRLLLALAAWGWVWGPVLWVIGDALWW